MVKFSIYLNRQVFVMSRALLEIEIEKISQRMIQPTIRLVRPANISDQPAHPHSLIRVFSDRMYILQPPGYPKRGGFNPRRGRQHSFVEIDHEIFSTVILSLPLIQEGQLSVSGERMCTILVNRLED